MSYVFILGAEDPIPVREDVDQVERIVFSPGGDCEVVRGSSPLRALTRSTDDEAVLVHPSFVTAVMA